MAPAYNLALHKADVGGHSLEPVRLPLFPFAVQVHEVVGPLAGQQRELYQLLAHVHHTLVERPGHHPAGVVKLFVGQAGRGRGWRRSALALTPPSCRP